jgi:hypothetical protein
MVAPRVRTAAAAAGLATLLSAGLVAPSVAAVAGPGAVAATGAWSATTPFPGKTPAKILASSAATAKQATGLHLKGTMVLDAEKDTVDAVLQKTSAKVTIATSTSGTFHLLRVGSTVYLGGDATFWTTSAGAAAASSLVGKWVKVTGTDADSNELRAQTTIAYWVNDLASFKVTKRVAGKVIRRTPTVGLVDPAADGGTIYVATKGRPYPLQVVSTDGKSSLSYYDWNKKVKISAPAAKLVVAL